MIPGEGSSPRRTTRPRRSQRATSSAAATASAVTTGRPPAAQTANSAIPAISAPSVETLRAYLDCGGSSLLAAGRLYCHRNTVLKRLRRVEHLIGGPLTDATVLLETQLALEALLQEQSR